MVDWGVPDWRDASAYPKANDITLRQWWWQFTRRDPRYRQWWTEALNRSDPHEPMWRDARTVGLRMNHAGDITARRRLEAEFRMTTLLDPCLDLTDASLEALGFPRTRNCIEIAPHSSTLHAVKIGHDLDALIGEYERREQIEIDAGLVRYIFNLNIPLQPQLEQARQDLIGAQSEILGLKNTRKPRMSNWTLFLRALDAKDAGVTLSAIAAGLWPDQNKTPKSAHNMIEYAINLQVNFPI